MLFSNVSYFSNQKGLPSLFLRKAVVGLALLAAGLLFGCQAESNDFMQALQDGDSSAAFALLDAELQAEFGGESEFQEWAEINRPISWSFGSRCSANLNSALANGSGRLTNDERFFIALHLRKTGDIWLIQGIEHSIPTADVSKLWGVSSQLDCSD